MRILFDPEPPVIRWCRETADGRQMGQCALGVGLFKAVRKRAVPLDQAASISYRLHHGGELIRQPVTLLTPDVLQMVRDSVGLLPEHNELTYQIIRHMQRLAPRVPHILLCDTAFFIDMPSVSSTYAIPGRFRGRGARRYGGCGLLHQWAWQKTQELGGRDIRKMISIQLGDHTNVTALKDGHPVDTTMGFTPVEGIPSHTSCGDIDVSVVFELQSSGLALSEINEMLSARSGWRGLAGKRCGFRDLLVENGNADKAMARRILLYDIVKYIGAFTAILGGVDAVAFIAEDPEACALFISSICRELAVLGLRLPPVKSESGDGVTVFNRHSRVMTVVLKDDLWRIMSCRAAAVEKEDQHGH